LIEVENWEGEGKEKRQQTVHGEDVAEQDGTHVVEIVEEALVKATVITETAIELEVIEAAEAVTDWIAPEVVRAEAIKLDEMTTGNTDTTDTKAVEDVTVKDGKEEEVAVDEEVAEAVDKVEVTLVTVIVVFIKMSSCAPSLVNDQEAWYPRRSRRKGWVFEWRKARDSLSLTRSVLVGIERNIGWVVVCIQRAFWSFGARDRSAITNDWILRRCNLGHIR
jgi:hypothetical protein